MDDIDKNKWDLLYFTPDCGHYRKGDKVFLRSNPEKPLWVSKIDRMLGKITVKDKRSNNFIVNPKTILHYDLRVFEHNTQSNIMCYQVCLN